MVGTGMYHFRALLRWLLVLLPLQSSVRTYPSFVPEHTIECVSLWTYSCSRTCRCRRCTAVTLPGDERISASQVLEKDFHSFSTPSYGTIWRWWRAPVVTLGDSGVAAGNALQPVVIGALTASPAGGCSFEPESFAVTWTPPSCGTKSSSRQGSNSSGS